MRAVSLACEEAHAHYRTVALALGAPPMAVAACSPKAPAATRANGAEIARSYVRGDEQGDTRGAIAQSAAVALYQLAISGGNEDLAHAISHRVPHADAVAAATVVCAGSHGRHGECGPARAPARLARAGAHPVEVEAAIRVALDPPAVLAGLVESWTENGRDTLDLPDVFVAMARLDRRAADAAVVRLEAFGFSLSAVALAEHADATPTVATLVAAHREGRRCVAARWAAGGAPGLARDLARILAKN